MKRDMDLMREILLEVEKADTPIDICALEFNGHACSEVLYHVDLLFVHGLLDVNIDHDMNGDVISGTVNGLTWDGCDYLDAIRNNGVWAKTKDLIKKTVGSTTVGIIKKAAEKVALSMIDRSMT